MGTRTTRPSSMGLSPKVWLSRMALAMACKLLGSKGVICNNWASGATTLATWFKGICAP
jgi:hypothetical protein